MSLVDTHATLQLHCLTGMSGLARLKSAWNCLADEHPSRRWEWNDIWWRHFGPGHELFTLVVSGEAGDIRGIAPFYRQRHWLRGRSLHWLGDHAAQHDQASLLVLPGCERTVAEFIAQWLTTHGANEWDTLDLRGCDTESRANSWFWQNIQQSGLTNRTLEHRERHRLQLPASWSAYLHRLPERSRTELVDAQRYWPAGESVSYRVVETAAELEEGLAVLTQLRHQQQRGHATQQPWRNIRYYNFFYDLSRRLHAQGRLRLVWMSQHERPLAACWGSVGGDTLQLYHAAVEQSVFSPLWQRLLRCFVLQRAIEEGLTHVDLGYVPERRGFTWGCEATSVADVQVVGLHAAARWRNYWGRWIAR